LTHSDGALVFASSHGYVFFFFGLFPTSRTRFPFPWQRSCVVIAPPPPPVSVYPQSVKSLSHWRSPLFLTEKQTFFFPSSHRFWVVVWGPLYGPTLLFPLFPVRRQGPLRCVSPLKVSTLLFLFPTLTESPPHTQVWVFVVFFFLSFFFYP